MGENPVLAESVIGQAWHRSNLRGLNPTTAIDSLPQVEIDREGRLIRAARPVLDQLAEELSGERFGLILTDEKTRILDRRVGLRSVGRQLDDISAAPGILYSEDVLGTNALGTANESGVAVAVVGADHFNESLREFCCFGAPVRNLVTGRIHGVLDICGHIADQNRLFPPYVMGAVRQIEQRLAEDNGESSMLLLAEYRAASSRSRNPVIALNDEVTFTSRAAQDLLDPADYGLFEDARLRLTEPETRWSMTLTKGREAMIYARLVPGGGGLFRVEVDKQRSSRPVSHTRERTDQQIVLVSGELGSGRTTRALEILGRGPIATVDVVEALVDDPDNWLTSLGETLTRSDSKLLLENVHLLPDLASLRLAEWFKHCPACPVVMTAQSDVELTPAQTFVTSLCTDEVCTVPLRQRRQDIPMLARAMLAAEGAPGLHISPITMSMIAGQEWRGNLVELKRVLVAAAAGRGTGDIRPADLPVRYRIKTAGLCRMEQVEREAIVDALIRTAGHRAHAAEYLGISRRTIFNRIRALRITEHDLGPPSGTADEVTVTST